MKCDDVFPLLDDFLDGLLTEPEAAAVRDHAAICSRCAARLADSTALRERVAELPRSIAPPDDLWPGIAARIEAGRVVRGRFGRRALLAAAAALLIVASVATAYLVGRRQATSELMQASVPGSATTSQVVLASFEQLGVHDYAATRQELVEVLQGRSGELTPETLEVVVRNLEVIDEAMARIALALDNDPGNELLQRQLIAVYRQQVDLLQRAAMLPSAV